MAKALVEIIGDAESFVYSLRTSSRAVSTFKGELEGLNVDVRKSAQAQVDASTRRIARMRDEMTAMRELAASYRKGSDEQIAAMELVSRKQRELNRLTGVSSRESAMFGGAGGAGRRRREERDASKLFRGGFAGAGMGGLGMSALAGGAFFGSFLAAGAISSSIRAATDAAAVERQLGAQYRANGDNLAFYRKRIDETFNRLSALAGFNRDELAQSFTAIYRASGDTGQALRDESIAVNLARGRHMQLQAAALLVAKVINGNVGILKRYGIETYKGETATQALAAMQQKFAGQAQAGTTAQERFSAELHNSQVIIGNALLPTVNHLLGEGAKWLDQMNRSGRLQRDVNTAVRDGTTVVHVLMTGVHLLRDAFHALDSVTGGFKQTLELLIGLKFASTISGWLGGLSKFTASTKVAEGEAAAFRSELLLLTAAPFIVTIEVVVLRKIAKDIQNLQESYLKPEAQRATAAVLAADVPRYARMVRTWRREGVPAANIAGMLEQALGVPPGQPPNEQQAQIISLAMAVAAGNKQAERQLAQYQREARRTPGAQAPPGPRTRRRGPQPITTFALPAALQNELAAALTPAQDRKAAEDALRYTQKLIDSGRLVGQAYTDALKERKRLYQEIGRDAKKLAGAGAGAGGTLVPASEQTAIARARAAAVAGTLAGERQLLAAQEHALKVLQSEHETGKARLKQIREEDQLTVQIATTREKITKLEAKAAKDAAAARDAATADAILGINRRKAQMPVATRLAGEERGILNEALTKYLFGSRASQAQLAYITRRTAKMNLEQLTKLVETELGDKLPRATADALDKINRVLELKLIPKEAVAKVRAMLAQIKTTLIGGLSDIGEGYSAYRGVSAEQFTAALGLTRAQRIAVEERYSAVQAHGGLPGGTAAAGIVIPGGTQNIHVGTLVVHGVQNLDELINEITKRTRSHSQRAGNRR